MEFLSAYEWAGSSRIMFNDNDIMIIGLGRFNWMCFLHPGLYAFVVIVINA